MTAGLKVMVVDDEPLALRRLELVLADLPGIRLAGTARTLEEAERVIEAGRPDVVLLDVELGGTTGFDLIERIDAARRPAIVFVTAFSHHAVRAFERDAVDYVLKPVEPSRLEAALDRARRRLERDRAEPSDRLETEFWIPSRSGGLVRVAVDDITSASSEDDYVRLCADRRGWLMRETLAGLERRLPPGDFVRIHRAHLVRVSAIAEVRRRASGGEEVRMEDGRLLPAGRVHARALRARLLRKADPRAGS